MSPIHINIYQFWERYKIASSHESFIVWKLFKLNVCCFSRKHQRDSVIETLDWRNGFSEIFSVVWSLSAGEIVSRATLILSGGAVVYCKHFTNNWLIGWLLATCTCFFRYLPGRVFIWIRNTKICLTPPMTKRKDTGGTMKWSLIWLMSGTTTVKEVRTLFSVKAVTA